MLKSPVPANESEREFDDLTLLASQICQTPIAAISLIDANRQWFKSRVGLDSWQGERDTAFCGHAIMDTDPFIVPDALRDERFADNPLVLGDPHIRFYAGVPLYAREG